MSKELVEQARNCSHAPAMVLCHRLADRIEELEREVKELVADATRYRVLANSIWYIGPESFYCGEGGDLYDFDNKNITKDILDAAVDVLAKVRKP